MYFSKKNILICFLIILGGISVLVLPLNFKSYKQALAQTTEISNVESQKQKLEDELAQLEKEIAEKQAVLDGQKNKSASLQNDINVLTTQISKTKLDIKAKSLTIAKLSGEIVDKTQTIGTLERKIQNEMESLGQLLKKTNEIEQETIISLVLSNESVSDFYSDIDSFDSIKAAIKTSVNEIRGTKTETEAEKASLQEKKDKEVDVKVELESKQRQIQKDEKDRQALLSISKNKEKEYQAVLAERAKRAAQIRSALFALRDADAIPFGKALEYATFASQKTGVRPAFILAILTQETNLGKNIGTCNRAGDPPEKSWKNIMKPSRDYDPYQTITSALGLNPDSMPLSCPWKGGYGGAMGPSQFIPSTWMMYKNKIATALGGGVTMPNPWEPKDAIMATAIYLGELGADQGGYTAERTAALKYYAGSNWNKKSSAFYGDGVMDKAKNIQENMIDLLQNA